MSGRTGMTTQAMEHQRIGVIGAGVMGKTLINGMLKAQLLPKEHLMATVHTQKSADKVRADLGVKVATGVYPSDWVTDTDIFLICTKPYRVAEVLKQLGESGQLKPQALVISIAAGTTIASMEALLPNTAVIRAMPNTPCLIGSGATVVSPGSKTSQSQVDLAISIFSSVGACMELDEQHMNAVTAVSGSGPAYIYLIMEALADGAVKVGLPRDVAFQLVSQTMLGSARMLQQSGAHPAVLKDKVTTPSGCTISALLTMEDGRIRSVLARAVEEATRTAGTLG